MTRIQFERKYTDAKTWIDYSRQFPERKAKFAEVNGVTYDSMTWSGVARQIDIRRSAGESKGEA